MFCWVVNPPCLDFSAVRAEGFDSWPRNVSRAVRSGWSRRAEFALSNRGMSIGAGCDLFSIGPYFHFGNTIDSVLTDSFHKLAAYQHAVLEDQSSNSYLNLIVYDNIRSYDGEKLHRGPVKNISLAIERGVKVKRLFDERAFCSQGYEVYLSFYRRTRYGFAKNRIDREGFEQWTKTLFLFPELVVLGALSGRDSSAFGVACAVEGTVIIKSGVHSNVGLELHTPDLMLHHWRLAARNDSTVSTIYDSAVMNMVLTNLNVDAVQWSKRRICARVEFC